MATIAETVCTKTPRQAIGEIGATLAAAPQEKSAAYTLILGAGFSYGVVPLTRDLVREHIGDYYYCNQDGAMRGAPERRELSASFWQEFNAAASLHREDVVDLDDEDGLPRNESEAYQRLFTGQAANALFSPKIKAPRGPFVTRMESRHRAALGVSGSPVTAGAKSANKFLKHVLDPGDTGRTELNAAHFFLAALLELQQTGELFRMRPFCRTIFTTNFDTLLQNALQLMSIPYLLTDRPERGVDAAEFPVDQSAIHVVYTHGTILRYNPASTVDELSVLSDKNATSLRVYLEARDILVFGYGGWDDSLMSALERCDPRKHRIYWCNVYPNDASADNLACSVRRLLTKYGGRAAYVSLGSAGADGFMALLYQALAPNAGVPALLRDPISVFQKRIALVKLDKLVLGGDEPSPTIARALPIPRLEMPAALMHGLTCRAMEGARNLILPSPSEPGNDDALLRQRSERVEARARALLVEGFVKAQAGDRDTAERDWAEVVKSTHAPSYERALAANYLGISRAQAGDNEFAIAAYGKALRLDRSSPPLLAETLVNRGVSYQHCSKLKAALKDFSEAIRIGQDKPSVLPAALAARALAYRALTHQMNGDASRAQHDFENALELGDMPADCQALLLSSRNKCGKDQSERACRTRPSKLSARPTSPRRLP